MHTLHSVHMSPAIASGVMTSASVSQSADQSASVSQAADQSATDTGVDCVPGDCLCATTLEDGQSRVAGSGTYERSGYIRSMLAGRVLMTRRDKTASIVQVRPLGGATSTSERLPTAGALVTCRVLSVTARFCRCDILCVGDDTPLAHTLRAQLRREEARAVHRDTVRLHECFRPGDFILARVLTAEETARGAASSSRYQLTTAEPALGVAMARGGAGAWLVPTSWDQMTCPLTQERQPRKVAKIPPEDVVRRIAALKVSSS